MVINNQTDLLDAVRHGGVNEAEQQISQRLSLLAQHLTAKTTSQGQGQVG